MNKGESVKEINLPDAIAERKVRIDWASEALRARYSDMFKPSERCSVRTCTRTRCAPASCSTTRPPGAWEAGARVAAQGQRQPRT